MRIKKQLGPASFGGIAGAAGIEAGDLEDSHRDDRPLRGPEDPHKRPTARSPLTGDGGARSMASWIAARAQSEGAPEVERPARHKVVSGAGDNIIFPDPHTTYELHGAWGGRKHMFEVVVSPEAAEYLRKNGMQLDLETGDIIGRDGAVEDFTARAKYEKDTGKEAPGWIFHRSNYEVFGLPMDGVEIKLDAKGKLSFDYRDRIFVDFDVIHYEMEPKKVWSEAAVEPARKLQFQRKELMPGVALSATTPEMMARAKALFFDHCGAEAAQWPERLRALEKEKTEVVRVSVKIQRAQETPDFPEKDAQALIARAKELAAPHDRSKWTLADARAALKARRAAIKKALKPVELVVVPAGKHWTSMPQVSQRWDDFAKNPKSSNAANAYDRNTRYVFLPEDDILAHAQTSRHELNHLVHDRLDRKTALEIRDIYERLGREGGPFARVYGRPYKEFFTTFGELFEGRHGRDALIAFRDRVGDLYEIYCRIRQRRPA